jgi:hypothetical protein
MQTTNTLILNFWALDKKDEVGVDLLREAFSLCPEINYIVWTCSPTVSPPDFLESIFTKVSMSKRKNIPPDDILSKKSVYVLHRSKVLPQLLVREARVEDNDDLLPILQCSNPDIAYGQEDFFLADLIQSQDERNKFFVGVSKNKPVGMLATSLDINAELLAKVFDLSTYPGLIIQPTNTTTMRVHVTLLVGDSKIIHQMDFSQIGKHVNAVALNVASLRSKDDSLRNASRMATRISNDVNQMNTEGICNSCIIYNFPSNELDARAIIQCLRSKSLVVDCIVEIQNVDDDVDLNSDEEQLSDMLDGVELLREHFTIAEEEGNTSLALWRKILVDGNLERAAVTSNEMFIQEIKSAVQNHKLLQEENKNRNKKRPTINAFAIALFSVDERFESRSEDLIKVAFEEYSTIDYCVLMVPNSVIPSAALIHWMQSPSVRNGISFDQSLYVMHKQSLLAQDFLRVTRISENWMPKFESYVSLMPAADADSIRKSTLRALRDQDVDLANNPAEVCFLIMLEDDIVGLIIVNRKATTTEDINFLRAYYKLDECISFERHRGRAQAMISHWVMNPIFSKWSRFVLREVMRLYCKTLLYFYGERHISPGAEVILNMYPVGIRRMNGIDIAALAGETSTLMDSIQSSGQSVDRPLFYVMKKQLVQPKTTIGKRIVIVGGSTSAFSLLEKFCLSSELNMLNIYLVMDSPPSPWTVESGRPRGEDNYSGCLSAKDIDDPTENEICALGLPHRSILIQGRLTDIDRKNRAIVVSDEVIVEYDILIISSHVQGYQV